jgi:hypothetical protein
VDEGAYYRSRSFLKGTVSRIFAYFHLPKKSRLIFTQHDGLISRCNNIAHLLREANHYRCMYPNLILSNTIITIISTTKAWLRESENAAHNALLFIEGGMRKNGFVPPPAAPRQVVAVTEIQWIWNDAEKDYYYWDNHGYFVYSKGTIVYPDGTRGGGKAKVTAMIKDKEEEDEEEEEDAEEEEDGTHGKELVLTHRKFYYQVLIIVTRLTSYRQEVTANAAPCRSRDEPYVVGTQVHESVIFVVMK